MATQLAEADLIDPRVRRRATTHVQAANDPDEIDGRQWRNPARGILTAMLISAPIWALIAYALYQWG
jgi:hypothetical protein